MRSLLHALLRSRRPEDQADHSSKPHPGRNSTPAPLSNPPTPPPHYIPWRDVAGANFSREAPRRARMFDFARHGLSIAQPDKAEEQARHDANERYLQSRANDPELVELNPDQRRAVLTDDDRCLIDAGAGTGKTHTLTHKIRDLVRQGRAAPHEIAVVTFTTKAAAELRERLADLPGIEIGTIHHLARTVIGHLEGRSVRLSRLAENNALRLRKITDWLRDALFQYPDLVGDLTLRRAALKSVRIPPGDTERLTTGVPPDDIQVRSVGEARIAITLWLCGIDYQYEPDFPLPPDEGYGRPYRPDFFIPDDPDSGDPPTLTNGVWLEHYAFGQHGQLPKGWRSDRPNAHQEYRSAYEWKQALHKRLGTRYVSTTFGDIVRCTETDISFAAYLAELLSPLLGRAITPPDEARVTEAIQQLGVTPTHLNELAVEIDHWIRTTRQSVEGRNNFTLRILDDPNGERTWPLLRLANAVLARYVAELETTETTDHEGTILDALRLTEHRGRELPWRRLLVDEYQDVNPAQAAFAHAIARTRPARLTVVGDEWQTIFSFNGSDVELIRRFDDPTGAFAPPATRITLTHTYRHGQQLADTARAFITAAGRERDKPVHGHGTAPPHPLYPARVQVAALAPDPTYPDRGEFSSHPATAAIQITLARCAEYPDARTVMILGRQHIDIRDLSGNPEDQVARILNGWRIQPATMPRQLLNASPEQIREYARRLSAAAGGFNHPDVKEHARRHNLTLSIITIHSAKGLEADLVILIDRSPIHTQPDRDPSLSVPAAPVLRPNLNTDQEERRIWYVALTRARQAAFILVPGKHGEHSPFADELWQNTAHTYDVGEDAFAGRLEPLRPPQPCPICSAKGRPTMALTLQTGPVRDFVGCTSYRWGKDHHCGYTERRCQTCGEGIMARRPPPEHNAQCQNPRCGQVVPLCRCDVPKPMLLRTNQRNGSAFYGCQNYPKEGSCNHTIDHAEATSAAPSAPSPSAAAPTSSPSNTPRRTRAELRELFWPCSR